MERWKPNHPAPQGEGDAQPGDTGGPQPVLFTTTNVQPLQGSEMSELDKLKGASGVLFRRPGAAYFNVPPGNEGHKQLGTLADVVYNVRAEWTDSNGKAWYLIDGGGDGVMRWVKA
jgi:hypothetical protein